MEKVIHTFFFFFFRFTALWGFLLRAVSLWRMYAITLYCIEKSKSGTRKGSYRFAKIGAGEQQPTREIGCCKVQG